MRTSAGIKHSAQAAASLCTARAAPTSNMTSVVMRSYLVVVALAAVCCGVPGGRQHAQLAGLRADQDRGQSALAPVAVVSSPDQLQAASEHEHLGRVQIKAYRGPSHHEHFAPHGFWVKQPEDDHHY